MSPQKKPRFDFGKWQEEGVGLNDKRKGYVEGKVDKNEPYFLFVVGSQPAALLGQTTTQFILTWRSDDETLREFVRNKLDFFLNQKGSEAKRRLGCWNYLIYNAVSTGSNFYSRVHLQYVEPPCTLEQAIQIWLRRAGKSTDEST